MPKLTCDCGTEYNFTKLDLRALAGEPFKCRKCGKTRKLPVLNKLHSEPTAAITRNETQQQRAPSERLHIHNTPDPVLQIEPQKRCPFCGEWILAIAKKCKHCREILDETIRERDGHVTTAMSLPPTHPRTMTKVGYDAASDTFTGTTAILVKLAMRAIQELGWKLDNANGTLGMVTFDTGVSWGSWSGVSCSLNIDEISEGQFRITGTGKQNVRGGQLLAINLGGEAQGRAMRWTPLSRPKNIFS
jgi:hypothetical protein